MPVNTNKIVCATIDKWHEARGLSGTRASAILGQNPYMTNVDVWEILTHKRKDKDLSDNEAVRFGLEAEKHIRALYRMEVKGVYDVQDTTDFDNGGRVVYSHIDKPYLTASVDGLLTRIADGALGVLEIKTTSILSSIHRETWRDGVPQNYYIQLLHEIMVLDASFGVLVAYLRYSDYTIIKSYLVERSAVEADIKSLFDSEVDYYEKYVATNQRPPLLINI